MKPWSIAGFALILGAGLFLVIQADSTRARTSAERSLIGLSSQLERYARAHEGRYPESLAELDLTHFSSRASTARDPWGRDYVYERHPEDAHKCRIYTLGRDGESGAGEDATELVLYRLPGRTLWKRALSDEPREW